MSTKGTTMRFVCNQDWNTMEPTERGRYCALCQKEVFDFTATPKEQLNALREQDACGMFLPEQVEEGITPIQLPKARFVAASLLTFIGMEVNAQPDMASKNTTPTEIILDDTTLVASRDTVTPDSPSRGLTKADIRQLKKNSIHRPFMHIGRSNFYWSRRFPFIVRRKMHVVGKF